MSRGIGTIDVVAPEVKRPEQLPPDAETSIWSRILGLLPVIAPGLLAQSQVVTLVSCSKYSSLHPEVIALAASPLERLHRSYQSLYSLVCPLLPVTSSTNELNRGSNAPLLRLVFPPMYTLDLF